MAGSQGAASLSPSAFSWLSSLSLFFFYLFFLQHCDMSENKNRTMERIHPAELICTNTVRSAGVSQSYCVKSQMGLQEGVM